MALTIDRDRADRAVFHRAVERHVGPGENLVELTAAFGCFEPVGIGGFDLLREYFMFPRKFLGFDLTCLDAALPRIKAKTVDIVFGFDELNPRLAAAVQPSMFALYTVPISNLFDMNCSRVPVRRGGRLGFLTIVA